MARSRLRSHAVTVLFFVLATWPLFLPAGTAAAERRKADLSRLVVIGDSLSAGFQNSSLHESQQPHGYAALVAAQAGTTLTHPLISAPGIPNVLTLVDPGPPPIIARAPGAPGARTNPADQVTTSPCPGPSWGTRWPAFPTATSCRAATASSSTSSRT